MNKAELLADLQTIFGVAPWDVTQIPAKNASELGGSQTIVAFKANVFDCDDVTMSADARDIFFYVFNLGAADESAFYKGKRPDKMKKPTSNMDEVTKARIAARAKTSIPNCLTVDSVHYFDFSGADKVITARVAQRVAGQQNQGREFWATIVEKIDGTIEWVNNNRGAAV